MNHSIRGCCSSDSPERKHYGFELNVLGAHAQRCRLCMFQLVEDQLH